MTDPIDYSRTEEARLIVERDTLRARVAELEAKIADGVFSCPGCGRHDFGFFASQIKAACGPCRTRAENAEARVAELEEIAADLRGDIESDVEKHKREVAALKAEIEALQEPPKKHVFGCSLANPHEQGAACVKPTAEGEATNE